MCPLSFASHEELKPSELNLVFRCVILPFIVFVRALVLDILFNMSGLTPFEETADSGLTSFSHTSASCAEVCQLASVNSSKFANACRHKY